MSKTKDELRIYKRDWARKKRNSTKKSLSKSETWKGRRGELIALQILKGSVDMNADGLNKPYDIKWRGKKIDVKSCNLYKRKNKRGKPVAKKQSGWWVFNKNKNYADKYFCICMAENIPIRYYLIPAKNFNRGITIGQKSIKFDKYLIINKTI